MKSVSALLVLAMAGAVTGQWGAPQVIAKVRIPGLTESSGVAASRQFPGTFWTHNDSGAKPVLFAFDRDGKSRARVEVAGARARDWEGMAIAPTADGRRWYLYLGDIGNNTGTERSVTVYRVPEPDLEAKTTARARAFRLRWPSKRHDAEALLVHPASGDLYIVSKARKDDPETVVYKAAAPLKNNAILQEIATLDLPDNALMKWIAGGVTGGDISPDGKRVLLCDYLKAYEAKLPAGARTFDAVWKSKWEEVPTGLRKQGEAAAYTHDGSALIFTSEGSSFDLLEIARKNR